MFIVHSLYRDETDSFKINKINGYTQDKRTKDKKKTNVNSDKET